MPPVMDWAFPMPSRGRSLRVGKMLGRNRPSHRYKRRRVTVRVQLRTAAIKVALARHLRLRKVCRHWRSGGES